MRAHAGHSPPGVETQKERVLLKEGGCRRKPAPFGDRGEKKDGARGSLRIFVYACLNGGN